MNTIAGRKGDWMQVGGGKFFPFDPQPSEIRIEDIANALGNICRFGGHTRQFYSVAQHSVLVSQHVPEEYALWGLLHDAAEAYIGDLPRPIKRSVHFEQYARMEANIMGCVVWKFNLTVPMDWDGESLPEPVKHLDDVLLVTEARDVLGVADVGEWWPPLRELTPLPQRILPWEPPLARRQFLLRFRELTGE